MTKPTMWLWWKPSGPPIQTSLIYLFSLLKCSGWQKKCFFCVLWTHSSIHDVWLLSHKKPFFTQKCSLNQCQAMWLIISPKSASAGLRVLQLQKIKLLQMDLTGLWKVLWSTCFFFFILCACKNTKISKALNPLPKANAFSVLISKLWSRDKSIKHKAHA